MGQDIAAGAAAGAAVGQAEMAARSIWGEVSPWDTERPLAGGVSGGFEFPSVEKIDELLGLWRARADGIAQRGITLRQIANAIMLGSVAEDEASTGYTSELSRSVGLLQQQHDSMLKYIQDYIGKLERVKAGKQAGEQDTVDDLKRGTGDVYAT
ncbi:hypothetical protein [Amycolatopsis anabasis]|uniref:hypothetical protein n=1 Tax=Amycolatopsis anabasis TaxID=1840409 RepID=UPI00131D41DB|nr:hypothetical protein [Amycolatopsis anabasis]